MGGRFFLTDGVSRNHEQTCSETGVLRQRHSRSAQRKAETGATTPDKITHAFTLKGYHWAYAMLEGERMNGETMGRSKVIENRHFRITPGWYGVVVGKGAGRREDYEMVRRALPTMAIPAWESQQAKNMRGKLVGIVQITHSVKTEMCTTPWAQGPIDICNVIAHAAWLPEFVDNVGGQGVHPIKGALGIVKKMRSQTQAALVCKT